MALIRPVRVFTDLKNVQKAPRELLNGEKFSPGDMIHHDVVSTSALERQIVVTGIGEITLPPDRFSITIKCRSSKDNVQDAKNSVTRRVDYIIQTFKNFSLKETDYKIYQHIHHVDSMVNVDCEMEAHFTDLNKCQNISNLLAEKLGPGVIVSLPNCYHARGSLDKLRKQVGMLAIHNARQKALEMARILHLSVGQALQVQELEMHETQESQGSTEEEPDINPSFQQRLKDNTIIIFSKVCVCFQLKPLKAKKNKLSA